MVAKRSGIHTVGRRKRAVARAYLRPGTGLVFINGKPYEEYFGRKVLQMVLRQPLEIIDDAATLDIKVNVNGGGISGQAGAVRHAIARALVKHNEAYKPRMRAGGFLTRDAREVERKKYGRHKARRRPQFSKR